MARNHDLNPSLGWGDSGGCDHGGLAFQASCGWRILLISQRRRHFHGRAIRAWPAAGAFTLANMALFSESFLGGPATGQELVELGVILRDCLFCAAGGFGFLTAAVS